MSHVCNFICSLFYFFIHSIILFCTVLKEIRSCGQFALFFSVCVGVTRPLSVWIPSIYVYMCMYMYIDIYVYVCVYIHIHYVHVYVYV